ncbi:unnamed protein product [Peniophora sp. CBMAI 1063]|nr:unnamed protein product [Peniophora sp. CBMAI 1063]
MDHLCDLDLSALILLAPTPTPAEERPCADHIAPLPSILDYATMPYTHAALYLLKCLMLSCARARPSITNCDFSCMP